MSVELGKDIVKSIWLTWSYSTAEVGFLGGAAVKNLPANAGDTDSILGSVWSPEEGKGNPLQYSCLGNSMDRGIWWTSVHEVAELGVTERAHTHTRTHTHTHTHTHTI